MNIFSKKIFFISFVVTILLGLNFAYAFTGPGSLTAGTGSGAISASGTNVGIGTANPSTRLYVSGPAITISNDSGSSNASIYLTGWNAGISSQAYIYANFTGGLVFMAANGQSTSFFDGATNNLTITGAGNVGIGTTTPSQALYVNGNAQANAFIGTISGAIAADNVAAGSFGSLQGGGIYSFPASLGVGTTTPNMKLEVNGGTTGYPITAGSGAQTNGVARFGIGSQDVYLDIGTANASPWGSWLQSHNLSNSSAFPILLNPTGGNVGIGVTSPGYKLEIAAVSSGEPTGLKIDGGATNGVQIRIADSYPASVGTRFSGADTYLASNSYQNVLNTDSWTKGASTYSSNAIMLGLSTANTGIAFRIMNSPPSTASGVLTNMFPNTLFTVLEGGNVGVGTTTPTQKLSVAGQIYSSTGGFRFPDGTVQTTAGGGGGSQWITSSTSIYYNTGNVGIGTAAPAYPLDVNGSARANAFIGTLSGGVVADNVAAGTFGSLQGGGSYTFPASLSLGGNGTGDLLTIKTANTGSTSGGLLIQSSGAGSAYFRYDRQGSWAGKTYIGNNASTTANAPSTAITVDGTSGTNWVGIGTTAPGARLDVVGNGTGHLLIGDAGIANYTSMSFNGSMAAANYNFTGSTAGDLFINRPTGGQIYFREANSDATGVIFKSGGAVGIGTTAPSGKLTVNTTSASANELLTLQNAQGWSTAGLIGSLQSIKWRDVSGVVAGIGATYNLGGTGTDVSLAFHSLYNNGYQTDSNVAMVIRGTGNVGIGTINPGAKLDVNGNILSNSTRYASGTDLNTLTRWGINDVPSPTNGVPGQTWHNIMTIPSADTNYISQLNFGMTENYPNMWLRTKVGGTWGSWAKMAQIDGSGYLSDLTGRVAGNLLDTTTWTVSNDSIGNWSASNSTAGESQRAWGTDPFGNPALLWKDVTDGANDASGGWVYNNLPIDNNKAYRETVWFMPGVGAAGNLYLGLNGSNTNNLNGTQNTNPYFIATPVSSLTPGRWYLLVGYVHAANDPSTVSYSGIYDGVTGQKVQGGTDYKNAGLYNVQVHRAFSYYNTAAGTVNYQWGPRFEEVNGSEPTIGALLGGFGANADPMYVNGNCSGAITVDWSRGPTQHCTLTGNVTFTFTNGTSGGNYRLALLQDATGGRTVTWPASVRWGSMGVPSLTATPSKTDYVGFLYNNVSGAYDGIAFNSNF